MVGKLHIEKLQKHLSKSVWLKCTLNHCRTFSLFGETKAQRTFFGLHAAHIPFFEVHMLQPTQGGLTLHIEKLQKHLSKSVWLKCTLNHCRTFLLFGETSSMVPFSTGHLKKTPVSHTNWSNACKSNFSGHVQASFSCLFEAGLAELLHNHLNDQCG